MAAPLVMPAVSERETVSCRICGSRNESDYLSARGYRIVQCLECGLWYVNPQPTPEELSQFYANYDDGDQWRAREGDFNRGIRKSILRFAQSGRLLDVGCGSGNFLACMREVGFAVSGIEPSETGAAYARDTLGVEIFSGMVEEYLATPHHGTFKVLTLLNVLEHLTDPRGMLLQLRHLMEDNAFLAVVVPDARFHDYVGKLRRRLGKSDPYWLEQPESVLSGFKLPDHLSSFQPGTISLLLGSCGFEIQRIENAPVVLNPRFYRNLLKAGVRSFGQMAYYASFRRLIFGYSTLVLARKVPDRT
ncbi:MAG: class I SAM-dependent methyltransferase [Candidatus Acidiferrales bacterium]